KFGGAEVRLRDLGVEAPGDGHGVVERADVGHRRERLRDAVPFGAGRTDGREDLAAIHVADDAHLRRAVPVRRDLAGELEAVAEGRTAHELDRAPDGGARGGVLHHGAGQSEPGTAVKGAARAHQLVRDLDGAETAFGDRETQEAPVGDASSFAHRLNVALRAMLRRVDLDPGLVQWIEAQTGATVVGARRNFGGGSRVTWFVDVERAGVGAALVLRHESGAGAFSGSVLSLARE